MNIKLQMFRWRNNEHNSIVISNVLYKNYRWVFFCLQEMHNVSSIFQIIISSLFMRIISIIK